MTDKTSLDQVKRFLSKAVRFMIIMIIVDVIVGQTFRILYFRQQGGKYYRTIHSLMHTEDDILIFGHSHTVKHFDPRIFTDILGMNCYNTGALGQGMLYTSAIQKGIFKRFHPKIVILNIDDFMLHERREEYERLSALFPYYNTHPEMRPIIELKNPYEKYKLISKLYKYNSTIVHILASRFISQKDFNGFVPQEGVLKQERINRFKKGLEDQPLKAEPSYDPNKIKALKSFIEEMQKAGIKLYAVASPRYRWNENRAPSTTVVKNILKEYGVSLWDYSEYSRIVNDRQLFSDISHLNGEGAEILSRLVAENMKLELFDQVKPSLL